MAYLSLSGCAAVIVQNLHSKFVIIFIFWTLHLLLNDCEETISNKHHSNELFTCNQNHFKVADTEIDLERGNKHLFLDYFTGPAWSSFSVLELCQLICHISQVLKNTGRA